MNYMRKFGLEYSDFDTIFQNLSFLLQKAGIHFAANRKNVPLIYRVIAGYCCICYVYVYQISMFWFVFVRCMETRDFAAASNEFSLGMCSFTGLTHFLYMTMCGEKVRFIVKKYLECDRSVIRGTRYYKNLKRYLRTIKKRALTIWSTLIANAIFYMVFPFLVPNRHASEDIIIYGLEPIIETPNYEIGMVLKTGAVIFAGYMVANIKALNLILYGYTEAHLLAMSIEIKSLWNDHRNFLPRQRKTRSKIKERTINKYIARQLRDIILLHIKIKELITLLEDNLRSARVIDMATVIFAVIAELLGGLGDTFIQANFTMVLLFMDCVCGQKIVDANELFIKSIYESKWENFDVANKKTVLVILMNAQKVMNISAGGVMDLNFVSFTAVMRFAYSTYATLKSSIKKVE